MRSVLSAAGWVVLVVSAVVVVADAGARGLSFRASGTTLVDAREGTVS